MAYKMYLDGVLLYENHVRTDNRYPLRKND